MNIFERVAEDKCSLYKCYCCPQVKAIVSCIVYGGTERVRFALSLLANGDSELYDKIVKENKRTLEILDAELTNEFYDMAIIDMEKGSAILAKELESRGEFHRVPVPKSLLENCDNGCTCHTAVKEKGICWNSKD